MKQTILAVPLLLAACAPAAPVLPPSATGCGVIGSREWAAWVNAMPGPNASPSLIVTGKADTPTGGYRIALGGIRVMESHPVQVVVELQTVPPAGPATQAIVTHEVRGQWPMSPPVGSVTVRCGGTVLATIAPVETAH